MAILAAGRDLLVESGYDRLSIEGVAARAGVGKQTVYRRFATKSALVAAVLLAGDPPVHEAVPAGSGDLRADLRTWLRDAMDSVDEPTTRTLVRATAALAADGDTETAERLEGRFTAPVRKGLGRILDRARADGSLRPDVDDRILVDTLLAVLLYRVVMPGAAPAERHAAAVVETVLDGIGVPVPPAAD